MAQKCLMKSRKNKMIAGVCGGIGEYLNIDPTIVRLIYVAISLAYGFGILLYIIMALLIPSDMDYWERDRDRRRDDDDDVEVVYHPDRD